MIFTPTRRATVLMPTPRPGRSDLKHLFVLLNDPATQEQKVVIVNLSSLKKGQAFDPACPLYPGDHPFVTRDSYVVYAFARIVAASQLVEGVRQGRLVPMEAMEARLVDRICQGLLESRHTPLKVKAFYRLVAGEAVGLFPGDLPKS